MARQWYAIEDRQTPGDEFGMHRLYTAEEWLDQAIDWLESDNAFDESEDDDSPWQSPEKFREIWGKEIKTNPEELIKFIDSYWEITMVEQGVDGHDYDTDFPEDDEDDIEGCSVTGSSNVCSSYDTKLIARWLKAKFDDEAFGTAYTTHRISNEDAYMARNKLTYNRRNNTIDLWGNDGNDTPVFKVIPQYSSTKKQGTYAPKLPKIVPIDEYNATHSVTSSSNPFYDKLSDKDKKFVKETEKKMANEVQDINPGNIYEYAVKLLPAEDIDHHESDLYIRKTPESTALINKMQYKNSGLLSTFRSNIEPHDIWYELPFCYTPVWQERLAGNTPIVNATKSKATRRTRVVADGVEEGPYRALAVKLADAIRTFDQNPDNLDNFESYLAYHFDVWMQQYAKDPEGLVSEFEYFANMTRE